MNYASALGFFVVAATFAGSSLAQDASAQKIPKPDAEAVSSAPSNPAAVTDVPSVVEPKTIPAPKPAGGTTPAATAAVSPAPPKKVVLPVSEIPGELKSKVSIAAQHVRTNELPEALALYTEVLTAKPELFTIGVERGKVYQQTKEHAKAIVDFGLAIQHAPDHYEAFFRRCVSQHETGAFEAAIEDCGKAIELNPAPAEYYFYRGLAYTALRTWDKAAADLAAATERNNEQPDAHLQLGRVYAEMDQLISALREYTLALQKRPGYPEAYKGRASVKASLGDLVGSKEDLSKATAR